MSDVKVGTIWRDKSYKDEQRYVRVREGKEERQAMMLTEEKAGLALCPYMTVCVNQQDVNKYGRSAIYTNRACAASQCMAWRWGPTQAIVRPWPELARFGFDHSKVGGTTTTFVRSGYCGRVGKPEG